MCCIFTCCGWMIDLIQRAWVFAMTCIISSAIFCFVSASSMSGVALGYNYSLAEYIDLKDTNVSVFLKRGVFDDEVVDEMDWRRGGGGMAAAQRRMNDEPAISSVPDFPFGYRRANDEGMFATTQVDNPNTNAEYRPERHEFEGALMKLTAATKHGAINHAATDDIEIKKVMTGYPQGSMDQLKAMQGLLNRRRMEGNQLGSDENKGYIPAVLAYDTTGSVTSDELGLSTAPSLLRQLLVQKLLNERKEAAKRFESMKNTIKTSRRPIVTGVAPEILSDMMRGSARRMGEAVLDPNLYTEKLKEEQLQNFLDPSGGNAPSNKWYYIKAPKPNIFSETPVKGPVSLSYPSTPRKIKTKEELLLNQEGFRRAMQENSEYKEINEGQNEAQQKDYDEDEVKGIPNRRRRNKRNRRNILVTIKTNTSKETGTQDNGFKRAMQENSENITNTVQNDSQQKDYDENDVEGIHNRGKRNNKKRRNILVTIKTDTSEETVSNNPVIEDMLPTGNRESLFGKLMSGLMKFKLLFTPEDEVAKVFPERSSSATLSKASSKVTTDVVSSSYVNFEASSTLSTSKVLKSFLASS